jgi:hypothetical protein
MRISLAVSGLLAAYSLLAPSLVVFAFFLLIIPGLILVSSPTVFVYLAAIQVLRHVPPISSSKERDAIAIVLGLVLGVVAMLPFHLPQKARFQRAVQEDIVPNSPIELSGIVRLESIGRIWPMRENRCDAICAALLDLPKVRAVVPEGNPQPVQFQLVSASQHPDLGLSIVNPTELLSILAPHEYGSWDPAIAQTLEARWTSRLHGEQRLVAIPRASSNPDWVLRNMHLQREGEPELWRVEVLRSDGTPVFRKSYVRHDVPAWAFYIGFHAGLSIFGPSTNAHFHLGKQTLESGSPELQDRADGLLLEAVGIRRPEPDPARMQDMRADVDAVLRDPQADPARLQLVSLWLASLRHETLKDDLPLVAKVLLDPRIDDVAFPLREAFRASNDFQVLREALVLRILMRKTSPDERAAIGELLARMPPGTFARPSAEEIKIWADPVLRLETAPWLGRVADMGAAQANPLLMAALEDAISLPRSSMKSNLHEGVRRGFVALGPEAASAVPRVRELFLLRPSPLRSDTDDAVNWLFTLARMGVAIENLPYLPGQGAQQRATIAQTIRKRLETYRKDRKAEE